MTSEGLAERKAQGGGAAAASWPSLRDRGQAGAGRGRPRSRKRRGSCWPRSGTSGPTTSGWSGELTEATQRLEASSGTCRPSSAGLARVPPPRQRPGASRATWRSGLRRASGAGCRGRRTGGSSRSSARRCTRGSGRGRSGTASTSRPAEGTRLAAVYAGHVVYTGWFQGYGNLIIVDHGNEYYTLYAHVAEIQVKEGDDVRQGQRIGTVGDTGLAGGAAALLRGAPPGQATGSRAVARAQRRLSRVGAQGERP